MLANNKKLNIIFSTVLGNIMEAYDFVVFGFMLKYIQDVFLPNYQSSTKYILSFLLFSIGYLGRPLGACILGRLGEQKGRKTSIAVSILILTISTALIGVLPTYSQIGLFAPILLIILRLSQNFSVSIEQVGGSLFLIESFPKNRQYFVSSCMFGSVYLGHILGLIVGLVLALNLSSNEIIQWGWRIPFLLALPIGCLTLYLRLKMAESPEFLHNATRRNELNINTNDLISTILSFVSLAGSAYLTAIYIPNMLHITQTLTSVQVFVYSAIVNFIIFCVAIISGALSDKNERNGEFLQKMALLGNIVLAVPIYWFLANGSFAFIILSQVLAACLLGVQAGTILGTIYSNYKFDSRYLTLNLGFNIAMTFFGGLSPFIVAYFSSTIHVLAPAIYLMVLSSITLFIISNKATMHSRMELSHN